MYNNIKELREHINEYGKGSLSKNERYHVVIKNCDIKGIHCVYLKECDKDILCLMDSSNSIIARIPYKNIKEIMICNKNFWDVLDTIYYNEGDE